MREVGGGSGESIKCFGFRCYVLFFSQLNLFFFSGFPYIPPPASSSCSTIFFFSLSIHPARLSRSLSASKCLELCSLCYTLQYWTTPDDHLYFSNSRLYARCFVPSSTTSSIPPIQLLQHRRLIYHPSNSSMFPLIHHSMIRLFFCYATSTSTYNYGHVSLFNRVFVYNRYEVCEISC